MIKCKKCNVELVEDDLLDIEFPLNANHLVTFSIGHCPKCGTNYQWEQHFDVTLTKEKLWETT